MLKRLFICIVFVAVALNGISQTLVDEPIEMLRSQIQRSKPDTDRVKLLLALSKKFILRSGTNKKDIDSSYRLLKRAEQLSDNLVDLKSHGNCILMAALIANKMGDSARGLILSQQALSLFIKINDLKDVAETYIIIGQHYDDIGNEQDIRIAYYKKAILIFQKLNLKERTATTLVDLSELQMIQDKFEEPVSNLLTALKIYQSIGYKRLQGLYSILGDVYNIRGDVVKSLKYGLLAVKAAESQKDTTLQLCTIYFRVGLNYFNFDDFHQTYQYFQKALIIARKYNDENSIDVVARSMAQTLYYLNRYPEALSLLKSMTGMSCYDKLDRRIQLDYSFLLLYLKHEDFKMAKIYIDKLESLSFEKANGLPYDLVARAFMKYYIGTRQYKRSYPYIMQYDIVARRRKSWRDLSAVQLAWFKADSGLGKYAAAIKHYQLYKTFTDSNFNDIKNKQTALLQLQFETEKNTHALQIQAKNIDILKKQSQLRQNEVRQTRVRSYWIMAGAIMLLLLLGLVYSRYRLKHRSNVQLEAKQLEIYHQNALLRKLVTEKDWLLKEVHHRVKNNLQIVMSLLRTQSAYVQSQDALEAIRESQNRVQSISLIHQKLYAGNNVASIDIQAYVADLINYLSDAFDTRIRQISFEQIIEPIKMDLAQAVPLGLILNEAITNTIKYAFQENGGEVIVALQSLGKEVVMLTVSDNGKGLPDDFDIGTTTTLGMEMMKALSQELEGFFEIKSKEGTTVSIEFQLDKIIPFNPTDHQVFI